MKRIASALLCSSLLFSAQAIAEIKVEGVNVVGDVAEDKIAAYRGSAKSFLGELKGALQAGMKEGGPVAAIGICNTKASLIADEQSKKFGWTLARTSLQNRSPNNAPDAWEKAVLKDFEKQKAAGADVMKLELAKIVEQDGQRQIRYMKAIPTGKLCLVCHGTEITADVDARLQELYPDDLARGYSEGDIRGAFSFTEVLK